MRLVPTAGKFLLVAILAGGFPTFRLSRPYQGFQGATFVDIPRGASTFTIAGMLAEAGVVSSRWDFLLARVVERGRVLQAGEYRFDRGVRHIHAQLSSYRQKACPMHCCDCQRLHERLGHSCCGYRTCCSASSSGRGYTSRSDCANRIPNCPSPIQTPRSSQFQSRGRTIGRGRHTRFRDTDTIPAMP